MVIPLLFHHFHVFFIVTIPQLIFLLLLLVMSLQAADKSVENHNHDVDHASDVGNIRSRHYCCARHQKTLVVGHGISGEEIKIDAGHCKSFCPRYFADDSGDPSRPAVQKCNWHSSSNKQAGSTTTYCRAKTGRLERISTIEGVKSVQVIDTCDCTKIQGSSSSNACRLESYYQTFYHGTPYQIELDLKACVGSCGNNGNSATTTACRPSRNASVSIRGPNGDEVHSVIEKCTCAGPCHRMDLIETILDFSRIELKDPAMKIADAVPTLRHINVGQCVGSCSSGSSSDNRVDHQYQSNKCLGGSVTLAAGHLVKCTPVKFKLQEYRTRRGQKREIIQITQCTCV